MRILVVEDEKKVAGFIKRGLEEEGLSVDLAEDGETGLTLGATGKYDLILMDVMLPKMDGLSAIQSLREKNVSTPILCLTAKDTVEDIVAGLDCGSDDYLTKPFAFAELVSRVKALIRRNARDRGAELLFADLRIDPVSHKVWRNDKEIDLTSKEYALLEYFMRNPNQALTRTMIAEQVWDYTFDTFTNIIDVYVNYLRKKIDRGFDTKLIHTVRGVGYMLREPE
ncbi:response regulator transcription factor [Pelovirga terrestris]|uniref:Response regulator transcription factor n=1 Tax=Pelovirga terrestris TaxID=2771352 RepID=A0A8J6QN46_9BACT|nr:response regulator transcription factor [Pelovirga terrestris]MBD1400537.1 response regulator transcription factor [Pelovirga terrestris]